MSREDWEVFDMIRDQRKQVRRQRRDAFTGGPGWVCHCETHWSYLLDGDRLDYWPGTMRFRWRGKTMNGDVLSFIAKREKPE